ncbi:MAG: tRNA preQ1(34) S-adenosylmethionine ribosyltransferase-isomerase QueA [Paludibacteraceae bacterium]|nr:tRNA preQ1(34) S-adenosylmethionine ribosyltransferase-isomerase QueA [Paludibacteraceae bacterium]MBR1785767.1 tRNA preQ1(34) S-adenosylmethionine ribosyltransferase-isomerase QueA [Paludibacteraceae bacterium]
MKLSQFQFHLPDELIAQYPLDFRDSARLMVLNRKTGSIETGKTIGDIVNYFDEGDYFLFNDTKVFPARLSGYKDRTNATIEVFLLRELNAETRYWDVLVDPARKIRIGNKVFFDGNETMVGEVIDNTTSRGRTIRFLSDIEGTDEFREYLFSMGMMPLPSYIHRDRENPDPRDKEDVERYNTIFAKNNGAVAAPASGLHFSKIVFKRMELKGINWDFITDHIGLGIFKEIEVEDLTKHKMDSEQVIIPERIVELVDNLHANGKRLCAIGCDVMRALEGVAGSNGHIKALNGWINNFIFPPYDFTIANSMLTNFFMPQSTQMMIGAAFAGYENLMNAYHTAIKEGYRFGDYGDALLII